MIKATGILAVAYFIAVLLRRRPAAERHALWMLAMGSAALLPLFTLLLPAWHPGFATRIVAVLPEIFSGASTPKAPGAGGVIIHAEGIEPGASILSQAISLIWITGSIVVLLPVLQGFARMAWLASRSRPVSDPRWMETVASLSCALRLKRPIQLAQSGYRTMPMTWGVLRPQVLLPGCAAEWSDDRKRIVIAHELAHVRRLDWLVQVLAELVCVAYWFNPLFWVARNQLHLESERACDDAVLNLGVQSGNYATHLLEIARTLNKRAPAWLPAVAMARQFSLEKRLVAILNAAANRRALTPRTACLLMTATLCVVLPVAAIRVPVIEASIPAIQPARSASFPAILDDALTLPRVVEYTISPLYSDVARTRGVEGVVRLELSVDVDGNAKNLRVIKGLGFGLDENALLAVRKWRFSPGSRNGSWLEMTTHVDVDFNLRNAELNELIANDMVTRVGPGVVPPRIIHRVDPSYTGSAANVGRGPVVLDAVIQEDGTPKVVRVVRSLAWELDENAISALEQWRFSPAMKGGLPVRVRMNVEMNFGPI